MVRERPDRNVYILGAGFSAAAGIPLVNNFLDRAREFYDDPASGLDPDEQKQFGSVFAFKQRMSAAREKFVIDLDNIEHLFGLVEISTHVEDRNPHFRNDVIYLIAKTIQLAVEHPSIPRPRITLGLGGLPPTLHPFRDFGIFTAVGGGAYSLDMYDYFAALVTGILDSPEKRANRKDTIITFNYDLVCDDAIRRLGFQPNYRLPENRVGLRGDTASQKVDVLKLHGSTNWAVCSKCSDVQVLEGKLTSNPQSFRNLSCPRCNEGNTVDLLIVPPSWDKSVYREVIRSVWTKAVEELIRATRICIIGYSMPEVDAFFKYMLTLALARNDHITKLIVVDRNPLMEPRYREVFDHTFQERRFVFRGCDPPQHSGVINLAGITQFLATKSSLSQLSRAEMISGDLGVLPTR